jgi:hypothetical protein
MKFIVFLFLLSISQFVAAQTPSSTVRGKVYDGETDFPLSGARVLLFLENDSLTEFKIATDEQGHFVFTNVPVGKHRLTVFSGFYDPSSTSIIVNSGKETVVEVPLSESYVETEEVIVVARKKNEVINEMALISAQKFSVEETNRYAGSRADPARMASNFAGVQGADDSRNDIVIRGNSPLGVVWKVEGIDIPNPSHFAVSGSTGGPVTILNNKSIANSDFFMSAFPAQYGNSTSGVFDLKLRNGNNNKHELMGQFGFLGTEFLAEGPLNAKKNASYLVMGRYSTLSLFEKMNIQIGTDAVPIYGDVSFKFNWALKNGGNLSWFGLGGKSRIAIEISKQTTFSTELYGEGDRDQYFGTTMGVSGLIYKKSLNEKTFVTATLATSYEEQHSQHFILERHLDSTGVNIVLDSRNPLLGYDFRTNKAAAFFSVNHKWNKKTLVKAGINIDGYYFNQIDTVLKNDVFISRWNYTGTAVMVQPFVQWKWKVRENIDLTVGLHSQYFSLSNSISYVEPRVGWKWRMKGDQALFAGGGMHSQAQPMYTYTYNPTGANVNADKMDFTRSIHSGLGYEKAFKNKLNLRTETYYQYLYNIPVTVTPSSFSMINVGSGFSRFFPDSLIQNTGTGVNYGLEITVQKYFDKSFYFMFSGTLYDSKYTGSDGILRNTSYNGQYIGNVLAGKEFQLNEKQMISLGLKVTYAGGKRYGFPDIQKSKDQQDIIFLDSAFNERQFKEYFRLDLKLNWKYNAKAVTHEIGIDIVNVFNTKNLLSLAYSPKLNDPNDPDPTTIKQQLGRLPLFYYKIDFGIKNKR